MKILPYSHTVWGQELIVSVYDTRLLFPELKMDDVVSILSMSDYIQDRL